MLTRHTNELMTVLDTVNRRGWAIVEWSQLYLWYAVKKIKKEPYRDIQSKWDELTGSEGAGLYIHDVLEGVLLLKRKSTPIGDRT